jgi:UMF1 family MFS transporter
VGWVTYWSGSQRLGMGAVIVLFAIGFFVMLTVPSTPNHKALPHSPTIS